GDLASVTSYEETALARIRACLPAKTQNGSPAAERLRAAERALEAVLRFHLETRLRPAVGDNPWAAVKRGLEETLLDVRRRQFSALADAATDEAGWRQALRRADQLLDVYAKERSIIEAVHRFWGRAAEHFAKAGDYA